MNITIPIEDLIGAQRQPKNPTIEATGKGIQQQAPKVGRFHVTIIEKAPTREVAWANFERRFTRLREGLGSLGDMGNVIPSEDKNDVTRGLRTVQEYTVSGKIEITFAPEVFGEVISVFIDQDLHFSKPSFTFEKNPQVSPELLTAAAADARLKAASVAAGVGMKLGRLVSIEIGSPLLKSLATPISSWRNSLSDQLVCFSRTNTFTDWKIDEDKLETYDTEVEITVVFEVIDGDEVAQ